MTGYALQIKQGHVQGLVAQLFREAQRCKDARESSPIQMAMNFTSDFKGQDGKKVNNY